MTTEELMKKMEEAGQTGGSELSMRSEELQKKHTVQRIPSLKKELKKRSKLLLAAEIALPFNPTTGEVDETYNPHTKFRPPVSATAAALMIKKFANECEKTKAVLMRKAGLADWDTTDIDTFTEEDWKIFVKYRVPRLFSMNVVSVNIPAMTKDYSKDYSIKVDRDPDTGEIRGKWPIALQINKVFRDKIYEEVSEFRDKVASGELTLTEKQEKEEVSKIYGKNPVSDDHPVNWAELFEIPLTAKYEISSEFDDGNIDASKIKSARVISRYSKKLKAAVEHYTSGDWEMFDKFFDFFEIDMDCPTDGDSNDKMTIGLNTEYSKPTLRLHELPCRVQVKSAIKEFLDDDLDIEREVLRSIYISEYNDEVEKQLITALPTVLDLADEYCTEKVLLANKDIISLAFGDEGMEAIEEADAGVSDHSAGALDEGAAAKEQKEYDLNSAEFQDPMDIDMSELDEI